LRRLRLTILLFLTKKKIKTEQEDEKEVVEGGEILELANVEEEFDGELGDSEGSELE
jgi:hypothetical protein